MTEKKERFSWTEEQVWKMRELWSQAVSATAIGVELNVSRNAVLGKLHRLGLSFKGGSRINKKTVPKIPLPKPRPLQIAPRVAPVDMSSTIDNLLELRRDQCRWPIGDGIVTFCGKPAVKPSSYCADHVEMARARSATRDSSRQLSSSRDLSYGAVPVGSFRLPYRGRRGQGK